jgi:hypothetical protein
MLAPNKLTILANRRTYEKKTDSKQINVDPYKKSSQILERKISLVQDCTIPKDSDWRSWEAREV